MEIIGSSRHPERSSHPDNFEFAGLGQGQDAGHVVKEQDNGTCFCLYSGSGGSPPNSMNFFLCHVPHKVTAEELNKLPNRKHSPPDADLNPFGSIELGRGTSYVSVSSMVYCIGGNKGDKNTGVELAKEVRKFDTKNFELEVDQMAPPMNEGRSFAAVVAVDKIIFVFGGLSPTATEDSSWAECLNTDMPIAMQKWMPLKQPPFRLKVGLSSYAIPYKTNSILIADRDITKGGLLYNVRDGFWMQYKFPFMYPYMSTPVSVLRKKTVYGIEKFCLVAYDYDKQVFYSGFLDQILYEKDFNDSAPQEPYLMHLKDDIFCCFTLYVMYDRYDTRTKVLQCTTFQVTKHSSGSGRGDLRLHAMGYKSYKCGMLFDMFQVLPIQTRICLSNTEKRRNDAES